MDRKELVPAHLKTLLAHFCRVILVVEKKSIEQLVFVTDWDDFELIPRKQTMATVRKLVNGLIESNHNIKSWVRVLY